MCSVLLVYHGLDIGDVAFNFDLPEGFLGVDSALHHGVDGREVTGGTRVFMFM